MKLTLFLTLLTFSYALSFNPRRNNREYYELFEKENSENEVKEPLPSIDFTADWKENVHGKLAVGRKFRINYAASRLQAPISVEYKFNDGPKFRTKSMESSDDSYHTTISIPIDADKVVIWFKHEDDTVKYDSDYGQNYHFQITQPSIVFLKDWQEKQHGALVQGGTFDVFYDSRRLDGDIQVEAEMKFADDTVVAKSLVKEDSPYQTAVISIPEDAEKVVMWFYYEDDDQKKHYDSDYGKNYHFKLS